MIELKNVTKDYDGHLALRNLNLTIQNGEIVGLIGHNGAGKSTTIKSLVSVINPTSGQIIVDGQELSANRLAIKKKIGYVADSPDLFLRLTANEFWELVNACSICWKLLTLQIIDMRSSNPSHMVCVKKFLSLVLYFLTRISGFWTNL